MPRKPRFIIPHVPVHIVQRGHSRDPVFFDDADYLAYLNWLKAGALRYKVAVHAYVLMTNHVHILVTPTDVGGIARMMQYVGRHYVPTSTSLMVAAVPCGKGDTKPVCYTMKRTC